MFDGLKNLFKHDIPEDEEVLNAKKGEIEDEIRTVLLESDVSFEAVEVLEDDIRKRIDRIKKISKSTLMGIVRDTIRDALMTSQLDFDLLTVEQKPYTVLFLGINGTGKTTTIAKVAKYLKDAGKRSVISASDTFRAGAIDQISILGDRVGVKVIRHEIGSDPSAVAFDAIEHARARGLDYVLIDSAGRMQTNKNLVDEMKKIRRVSKPNLTVLVLDSMVGQDVLNQAETFLKEIGFDAIILTKLDTDAKGGSLLSIVISMKKPVLFLCTGQGMDDIVRFDPDWYLDKIFS
ncbi:MAG: signal recognition particle-docking protein FtsY [Thermoplasmatales archaeon B_DKE]|nr:MAG: signal recognition particle-docking protein FtsY [Thermoplasmatales archaeon B_DKE]